MPVILSPASLYQDMITVADLAGKIRIRAKAYWILDHLVEYHPDLVKPGKKIAYLRCDPPPCIELWVVADESMVVDWEPF